MFEFFLNVLGEGGSSLNSFVLFQDAFEVVKQKSLLKFDLAHLGVW